MRVVQRGDFGFLFRTLKALGYELVGPKVQDSAIVYAPIEQVEDLPIGWTDEQEAGYYRLKRRGDSALFAYAVGPHSWKKYMFPPRQRLFQITKNGQALDIVPEITHPKKRAFIGIRSCELHAIGIQDRVFTSGPYQDSHYQANREHNFFLAVNCGEPAQTCFCASMQTGPRATGQYDLALTEIVNETDHYFVVEIGSDIGESVLAEVPSRDANHAQKQAAAAVVDSTKGRMGRALDTVGLKMDLQNNHGHPRWDDVAQRCLSCANCTMVCPTCFCSTVEDTTDLQGDHAERWRYWDSCFNQEFSYIAGGSIRSSVKSRYRQWMTHKLASWIDQFDTSGCVGCGRCITWCPVGIDITVEAKAIRQPAEPITGART